MGLKNKKMQLRGLRRMKTAQKKEKDGKQNI